MHKDGILKTASARNKHTNLHWKTYGKTIRQLLYHINVTYESERKREKKKKKKHHKNTHTHEWTNKIVI